MSETGVESILICDGHNMAYRAFFAIRNLSTAAGIPTNAVFGFVREFCRMTAKLAPSHLVMVFDGGLPERRKALLDSYKAQRPHMPEELRSQMALIRRYLDCANIYTICLDGEEADDVMATIAMKAEADGARRVVMATNDKDMYQVVSSRIAMYSTTGGIGLMGPEDVKNKTGVLPGLIPEWLALMGDSADNIPGITGVGPKTASKLLNRFGSIDEVYANIEMVESERIRSNLKAGRGLLERNVSLTKLITDLKFKIEWDEMAATSPDHGRLLSFFEEMEFHRMAKDMREPQLF